MIAIKDMEMPKNCASCVMRVGKCKERIYMENRPSHCPLIEIKTDGDMISRQAAIDAINELHDKPNAWLDLAVDSLEQLPPAHPEAKPIDYRDCADAMLMMWMWNVLTDGEYYRIMDKLNEYEMRRRAEEDG